MPCPPGAKLIPMRRLFNIGVGRPSMIRERDITASMASLDSADEFAMWDSGAGDGVQTSCRCVSLATDIHQIFAGITEVLDSM